MCSPDHIFTQHLFSIFVLQEAGLHVESMEGPELSLEKPPDYATVVDVPPCYEDAIKLNPAALLPMQNYNGGGFIEKSVSITKDEPARVNITVPDSSPDPKKWGTCDKGEGEVDSIPATHGTAGMIVSNTPNNAYNSNTLSKVLRKSIRGIRKQLTTSAPSGVSSGESEVSCASSGNGGGSILSDTATSSVATPTTSSRSHNVVAVFPSGFAVPQPPSRHTSVHKTPATHKAQYSRADSTPTDASSLTPHSQSNCSPPLGDPPAYEETINTNTSCQSCSRQSSGQIAITNIDTVDAASGELPNDPRVESTLSPINTFSSQVSPMNGDNCGETKPRELISERTDLSSPPDAVCDDLALISNKVTELTSTARSEAQTASNLAYIELDASRNR